MAKEKLMGLPDRVVDAKHWQEEAERQCATVAEELALLQIRGSELCLAIVAPSIWDPLREGMWVTGTYQAEMVRQLGTLQAVVSSSPKSVLGSSPIEAF
jgi:hypothetical protein